MIHNGTISEVSDLGLDVQSLNLSHVTSSRVRHVILETLGDYKV